MLAVALLIAMIYFQNSSLKSKIVQEYKKQLPSNLQNLYEKIVKFLF
jgi:cation transport regulator ChaB